MQPRVMQSSKVRMDGMAGRAAPTALTAMLPYAACYSSG